MSSLADALSTLSDRGLRRLLGARTFLRGLDYEKRRPWDAIKPNVRAYVERTSQRLNIITGAGAGSAQAKAAAPAPAGTPSAPAKTPSAARAALPVAIGAAIIGGLAVIGHKLFSSKGRHHRLATGEI